MRNNRSRRSSRLTNESFRSRRMRRRMSERYIVESERDNIIKQITDDCKGLMEDMDEDELYDVDLADLWWEVVWNYIPQQDDSKGYLNMMGKLELYDWSDIDYSNLVNTEIPLTVSEVVQTYFSDAFYKGPEDELNDYLEQLQG